MFDLLKTAVPKPEISSTVENISRLPNEQIRRRVADLATAMRIFEGGRRSANAAELIDRLPPSATREQRHAAWTEQTTRMLTRSAEEQTQFRIQFLPQALALREAMLNRLGIMPPYPPQPRVVALDFGMLAGVSPISDAANYLEELARRLPP
jgi:hypothetical protein